MNFSQIFQDNFGNFIPTVRAIAQGMDEQEAHLDRLRLALGLGVDWLPQTARKRDVGANGAWTWQAKFAGLNGRGDLHALLSEMCEWMDLVEIKRRETELRLVPKPAAPTLHEFEDIAPLKEYAVAPTAPPSLRACPKCGKVGGHIKACSARAA